MSHLLTKYVESVSLSTVDSAHFINTAVFCIRNACQTYRQFIVLGHVKT